MTAVQGKQFIREAFQLIQNQVNDVPGELIDKRIAALHGTDGVLVAALALSPSIVDASVCMEIYQEGKKLQRELLEGME